MTAASAPSPAQVYQDFFGPSLFTPWAQVMIAHADLRPGQRILDLACGTGIVTRAAAAAIDGQGELLGLDVSPAMLSVARSEPAPAPIVWQEGNGVSLELPDGAFDRVLCQQGLQFFPDRAAGAREMRRVSAPGGRVVAAVWQGLDRHPVYAALFEAESRELNVALSDLATPFGLSDAGELEALFRQAGFATVEVVPHTMPVSFPAPERFVRLTMMAGAAVLPQLPEVDLDALIAAVSAEISEVLARHRIGDAVTFPMSANIAVATA